MAHLGVALVVDVTIELGELILLIWDGFCWIGVGRIPVSMICFKHACALATVTHSGGRLLDCASH